MPNNPITRATLISQSFAPETHAGANRANALAKALSESYDLTVIAPMPSHPTPERFADVDLEAHDRELPFRVQRCDVFRPHTTGYLRRGVREALMAFSLARGVDRSTDVIFATTPSFFVAPAAMAASWYRRTHFHWDIRDLTWEYAGEAVKELQERQRLRHVGSVMMRFVAGVVARHSDSIIASNSGIAEYFEARFKCHDVQVARNGVSQQVFNDTADPGPVTQNGSRFRVVYVGAVGYFQALDTLLDAAEELPGVEFRIVGDGPERDRLSLTATSRGLRNVTFTGFVGRERVYEEYGQADILFAQLRKMDVTRLATVPSKVYEYLAAGKPIIYGGEGITADFLGETGAVQLVAPQQTTELVDAINVLRNDPALRLRMGRLGRKGVQFRIREDMMREAVRKISNQSESPGYRPFRAPDSLEADAVEATS